ncbi:FecR domain-containing protein [Pseudomonas sp. Gutcm_11s]|uniref:FecR domain-containing protein n=1 Tax=Pseudomonas sp. Gutcm_11s TaxID=3026088 RepID=UPI002363050C|nr:FecR domain-containing protein [Pseudomonas sp. Gutcm_11s]MDD0844884.1 FecR domain-containing protein [Pseudomonas sp. Gutcm_11s]
MSQAQQIGSTEREAIRTAAQWYARLTAETASEGEQLAWQRWLESDPAHYAAWQRIESVRQQMGQVPGQLAASTLAAAGQSRRRVLLGMALLVSASGVAGLGWRSDTGRRLAADFRTTVGERRSFTLADGSQLLLNTDSAVDALFDEQQRLLVLRGGEVLIETAPDPLGRPFSVATAHGNVRALGTRFTVRVDDNGSNVAVLAKAVEVSTPGMPTPVRLEAGQQTRFTRAGAQPPQTSHADVAAWQQGSLIAIDRPLGELIDELARYRSGWLRCDPAIAGVKVSGAFPLDDTDRALDALEKGFPIRVVRRTRYWVSLVPRS